MLLFLSVWIIIRLQINSRLSLEWNSLGIMSSNAFPEFCQSLGMNKSLKDLDLRNNQITHTSALELCTAIEANMTLQNLGITLKVSNLNNFDSLIKNLKSFSKDLRWNNIGLVGGKGLLTSLKKNHTLMLLQIAGNNIPEDICEAIGKFRIFSFKKKQARDL